MIGVFLERCVGADGFDGVGAVEVVVVRLLREQGGLDAASYPELGEDVRDMHAHGLVADIQPAGDLLVAAALDDRRED